MRAVFCLYRPGQAWLIFALALLVRAAYALFSYATLGPSGLMSEDSAGLLADAHALLNGETLLGFDGRSGFDAAVMPITPLVLAGVLSLGGGVLGFVLLQAVIDAMTCLLVAKLAGALRRDWFLMAGLVAAFNPTQVVLAGLVLTDTLFLFFCVLSLVGLAHVFLRSEQDEPVWPVVLLVAAGLGLACLTRSAILFWLPVGLLLLGVGLWRAAGVAKAGVGMVAAACLIALCMAPVLYRNLETHGEASMTRQGGAHLLFWVVPLVANFGGDADRNSVQADARARLDARLAAAPTADRDEEASALAVEMLAEMGPVTVLRAWTVGATLNLGLPATTIAPAARALPHDSFHEAPGEGVVEKVVGYITAPQNRVYVAVNAVAALGSGLMGLLLLIGLWRFARYRPTVWLLLVLWGGYFLALSGPIASPKYRLPIEPAWTILIVAALAPRTAVKTSL